VIDVDFYAESIYQYIRTYLDSDRPLSPSGCALYMGITTNYLRELIQKYDKIAKAYEMLQTAMLADTQEKALKGEYKDKIAMYYLTNHFGWTNKSEVSSNVNVTGDLEKLSLEQLQEEALRLSDAIGTKLNPIEPDFEEVDEEGDDDDREDE